MYRNRGSSTSPVAIAFQVNQSDYFTAGLAALQQFEARCNPAAKGNQIKNT